MRWFLYNVLFTIAYVLLMPKFIVRMCKRGGYRKGFMQRAGVYEPAVLERIRSRPRIWVHAVSVGEVFVALKYMEEFRRQSADVAFVLSTNTSTGHRVARERLHADDVLVYVPTDFTWIVKRVLRKLKPRALVLTEGEYWPNLIRHTHSAGVPMFVINGRISRSSYRGYRKIKAFFRPILNMISAIVVQGKGDAERLIALGADRARVHVMGTAKYDVASSTAADEAHARRIFSAAGISADSTILVGGSTWPGEEEALVDIYRSLLDDYPGLRLVLVPRHAERRAEAERVVAEAGLVCIKRSELDESAARPESSRDVLVVDTTGELTHVYSAASVIFVGKSLANHGGQNIIEPAAQGKAIVVGPNMENFPDVIEDFLGGEALIQVRDRNGLREAIASLLASEERRAEYGRRAKQLVAQKRGTIARSVEMMLARLSGAS